MQQRCNSTALVSQVSFALSHQYVVLADKMVTTFQVLFLIVNTCTKLLAFYWITFKPITWGIIQDKSTLTTTDNHGLQCLMASLATKYMYQAISDFIDTMSTTSKHSPLPCHIWTLLRSDSRFASSQWEKALLCNDVSHWLGANLESSLITLYWRDPRFQGPYDWCRLDIDSTSIPHKVSNQGQSQDLCHLRHSSHSHSIFSKSITGLILGLRPANERRRYFVTTSLIGSVQA